VTSSPESYSHGQTLGNVVHGDGDNHHQQPFIDVVSNSVGNGTADGD